MHILQTVEFMEDIPKSPSDIWLNENERLATAILGSPALVKACFDTFDYALKLRTGQVIRFGSARIINTEWVHIDLEGLDQKPGFSLEFPADRGVDVRIADIVWVMDAPEGS